MPNRHLHLQRITTISQILRNKHSRLLANQERSAISVAADIIRADRQVSAFEAFDAVDVEAGVEDAVLDDGVAFFGCHAAGADKAILGWFTGLSLDGPATVLDASGEVVRAAVGFGVLKVEILSSGRGIVCKESVRCKSQSSSYYY